MTPPLATIGQRFTGQFLDGLIAFAFAVPIYFAAKAAGLPLELAVAGWVLYLLVSDGLPGGQSLGKRVVGIQVVHAETGVPCGYGRSLVRNLSLGLLSPLDELTLLGAQRRRLGDFLARTRVVQLPR
jgi:uncharacterized RDD family membrane protein YckC